MNEEDQMLMHGMDAASSLLSCMKPSDFIAIRGQVKLCNDLMASELGSTNGITWAFSIESGTSITAGGETFIKGIRSALVWLRETVWHAMLEEGEKKDMQWAFGGKLNDDATFDRTIKIALDRIKTDRCIGLLASVHATPHGCSFHSVQ